MTTLAADARKPAEGPSPATAENESPLSPYPGLRPFSERDSRLFFGREREIAALLSLIEQQQLVVVHGTSGCGKSSVVRAGVVPVFRLDTMANSRTGRVIIIRPADLGGPLQSLARKLEQEFPRAAAAGECPDDALQPWSSLLAASPDWGRDIGRAVFDAGATLCIIIDQFEEIFAVNRAGYAAEVRRVIEFLISLEEPVPEGTALGQRSLSVILTMRSDYLGHCALWDGFAEAVNRCQYLLPRISTVGLLRAIHEPARRNGAIVDEAVADRLLPVIAREMDGLPILQHALMRAWQWAGVKEGRRTIDVDALDCVGGAEQALSRHADEAFSLATGGNEEREIAANWIFRSLSDLDSDGRIIRRSVSLGQLECETGAPIETVKAILDVFREPSFSLVMPYLPEELDETSMISVTHEALLRQWVRITDTRFDQNGRPIGLVYREFQDGMIWRALSLQARQYARDNTSLLGPAATEQRLPWFREIEQRSGWVARHQPQGIPDPEGEVRAYWTQLAEFMAASERNLEAERGKLARERELVATLRRNRKTRLILTGIILLLSALVVIAAAKMTWNSQVAEEKAQNEKKKALVTLYIAQSQTARERAKLYCDGKGLNGAAADKCMKDQSSLYIQRIGDGYYADGSLSKGEAPNSPIMGGFGPAPGQNGGDGK